MRIYTDGSCNRSGDGGWAWVLSPEGSVSGTGSEDETTNQRMEMKAVLEALRAFPKDDLTIVSDSTYVVNCFNQKWWVKWLKNEWLTSSGTPVVNRDLWEELLQATRYREVTFEWVKGHSTDPMNALADRLAHAARTKTAVKESTDKFELACMAMIQWWNCVHEGREVPPDVMDKIKSFLVKMKLLQE